MNDHLHDHSLCFPVSELGVFVEFFYQALFLFNRGLLKFVLGLLAAEDKSLCFGLDGCFGDGWVVGGVEVGGDGVEESHCVIDNIANTFIILVQYLQKYSIVTVCCIGIVQEKKYWLCLISSRSKSPLLGMGGNYI